MAIGLIEPIRNVKKKTEKSVCVSYLHITWMPFSNGFRCKEEHLLVLHLISTLAGMAICVSVALGWCGVRHIGDKLKIKMVLVRCRMFRIILHWHVYYYVYLIGSGGSPFRNKTRNEILLVFFFFLFFLSLLARKHCWKIEWRNRMTNDNVRPKRNYGNT